ncbi:MAG: PPC domain-containing protein, partial [Acidobacteriota bacterium]
MFFKGYLLIFLCLSAVDIQAQVVPQPSTLIPGQPIERTIAGGESHTYQISLSAGQFVHFTVEQKGIDVALVLAAPDGKQIAEFELTGVGGGL